MSSEAEKFVDLMARAVQVLPIEERTEIMTIWYQVAFSYKELADLAFKGMYDINKRNIALLEKDTKTISDSAAKRNPELALARSLTYIITKLYRENVHAHCMLEAIVRNDIQSKKDMKDLLSALKSSDETREQKISELSKRLEEREKQQEEQMKELKTDKSFNQWVKRAIEDSKKEKVL